tara:strand:+ start:57 stop:512 length:456 start_codon:yes stop_codon:yes gene_type:complete
MANSKSLDPMTVDANLTTIYPEEFKAMCIGREKRKIGDVLGLNNFGVNLVTLKPGAASAQRHWHSHSDEFVYILEGEVTLITDAGEQALGAGMVAGFPANDADGHHLVNKTESDVLYLEIGDRPPKDDVDYPDIDMLLRDGKLVHKDGTPY